MPSLRFFPRSLDPDPSWGYPSPSWRVPQSWPGTPGKEWGTPLLGQNSTVIPPPPPPPRPRQNSRPSTCYSASGMPFAVTYEYFLVLSTRIFEFWAKAFQLIQCISLCRKLKSYANKKVLRERKRLTVFAPHNRHGWERGYLCPGWQEGGREGYPCPDPGYPPSPSPSSPCERTNRVKTLPSPVLRMRTVNMET